MTGPFCYTTAKNNEEYKKVIKKRMLIMGAFIVVGILAAVTALIADRMDTSAMSARVLGLYTGAGTGMAVSGLFILIRDFIVLKNEKKLKDHRLRHSDERLRAIRDNAIRPALLTMLIAMYAVCLIGSIFYPVLIYVLLITVWLFLIVYLIAFRYYERKM